MLISPAFAQDGAPAAGFDPVFIIMMIGMFAVFWFLVIRPQQRKAKEHQAMLKAIKRGDQVVTNGGIIGRVARIEGDGVLLLEIADGVRVRCQHAMIADLFRKSEPREADEAEGTAKKKDG
jgi:preprotein translocase subunit YajC